MAKRFRQVLIISSVALVVMAACSFPDVEFLDSAAAEAGSDTGNNADAMQAGGDTGMPPNTKPVLPPDVDPEGGTLDGAQEATVRPDGGSMIDAAGCTCDCDEDTFQKTGGSCDGGPGPRPDCDDLDNFIRPNQGFVAESKWTSPHTPSFDWNCDGTATKELTHDVKCNDLNNCLEGFNDDPACGEKATYNICKVVKLLGLLGYQCQVDHTLQVQQTCK